MTVDVRSLHTAAPKPVVAVAAAAAPEVSFVTVTFGTGPVVVDMIASLVATAVDDSGRPLPIEMIVVDNPHPVHVDRTYTDLLLATRGVRVLRPATNLGFGGGCNLGARAARGRLLGLLNPDLTLLPGWLAPLYDLLDGDPSIAIAAPVLVHPDGSVQECGQALYADGTTSPFIEVADTTPIAVDYASAACWLLRARDFEALGGFDPSFFPAYFEDVDFALRARAAGSRCVVHPGSRVAHHSGTGTPDRPQPAHAQRERLVAKWPQLATAQPGAPAG